MKEKTLKKRIISMLLVAVMTLTIALPNYEVLETNAMATATEITPVGVKDINNFIPVATIKLPAGTENTYNYLYKFTLSAAANVRIATCSRYTFWNWNGTTSFRLYDTLAPGQTTVDESWETYVNADHPWGNKAGNYSDNIFTLDKGTYYFAASVVLTENWLEESFFGKKASEYGDELGLELGIYSTDYTKTPTLKSVKNKSPKTIEVKFKKVKDAAGYEIQYSTNKNFKRAKKVTTNKPKVVIKKSLKKKKTYYVRVAAYRELEGKKYYSAWSKVKKVKIRK